MWEESDGTGDDGQVGEGDVGIAPIGFDATMASCLHWQATAQIHGFIRKAGKCALVK